MLPTGKAAPFNHAAVRLSNESAPLTTSQVYQCALDNVITEFCFMAEMPDLGRLGRAIDSLCVLYPFLDSHLVFDPAIQWARFEPKQHVPYKFAEAGAFTELNQLSGLFKQAADNVTCEKLASWKVFWLRCAETPMFQAVLTLQIAHILVDGSSVVVLLKKLNELFVSQQPPEAIYPISRIPFNMAMVARSQHEPEQAGDIEYEQYTELPPLIWDAAIVGEPLGVRVRFVPPNCFSKISGFSYSISLYAVNVAVMAAYLFLYSSEGADAEEQRFCIKVADFRRVNEQLELMMPGLDLSDVIGPSVVSLFAKVKGNRSTSIAQIAREISHYISHQLQNIQQVIQWNARAASLKLFPVDTTQKQYEYTTTNIGYVDLQPGPIVQSAGYNLAFAYSQNMTVEICNGSVQSGPHGTFVIETEQPGLGLAKQDAIFGVVLMLHQMLKEQSAEEITVEHVMDLLGLY